MAQPANFGASTWQVRAHAELAAPRRRAVGLAEAASFEVHPDAQFVLAIGGELLAVNRAGRELIARSESLRVHAGRLVAGSSARMRMLCDRIAATIRTQAPSPEIEMPTAAQSAVSIRVFPLGATFDAALLIVRERASQPEGSASERYGFTPAEALVAERLARGQTVPRIAVQLGISIDTVRCHLKQAFAKAGVHRQAELVAVMLAS